MSTGRRTTPVEAYEKWRDIYMDSSLSGFLARPEVSEVQFDLFTSVLKEQYEAWAELVDVVSDLIDERRCARNDILRRFLSLMLAPDGLVIPYKNSGTEITALPRLGPFAVAEEFIRAMRDSNLIRAINMSIPAEAKVKELTKSYTDHLVQTDRQRSTFREPLVTGISETTFKYYKTVAKAKKEALDEYLDAFRQAAGSARARQARQIELMDKVHQLKGDLDIAEKRSNIASQIVAYTLDQEKGVRGPLVKDPVDRWVADDREGSITPRPESSTFWSSSMDSQAEDLAEIQGPETTTTDYSTEQEQQPGTTTPIAYAAHPELLSL